MIYDVIKRYEGDKMNRILVVDDEVSIADMIKLCLSKNGYECETANDGLEASRLIEKNHYDLALLDIMIPEIDGFELIEYMKQYDIPVIFVTAKAAIDDRVKGLHLGAEDYLIKPFALQELVARVQTVLRRYNKTQTQFVFGNMMVDLTSHIVSIDEQTVPLSSKEYELLIYLIRNKNIALYREKIYEHVWKEPYYSDTRTIDLHIQRLKKKLNLGDAIETIYKVGYKFVPERLK